MLSFTRRRPAAVALCLVIGSFSPVLAQDPGLPPPAKKPKAAAPLTVKTDFDPKVDGFSFVNVGDYGSPGGDCLGMSLLAVRRYLARKAAGAPKPAAPDFKKPSHDDPEVPFAGDPVEHEAVGLAQSDGIKLDSMEKDSVGKTLGKLSDPSKIKAGLERIAETGTPELMMLVGGKGKAEDGHATVLFGYEDGDLLIYDSNFPGETIRWPWDPVKGLGKHPKRKSDDKEFYSNLKLASSTPYSRFRAVKDLDRLVAAAEARSKEEKARFAQVTMKIEPSSSGKSVTITGTVSRGERKSVEGQRVAKPYGVWVRIDGKLYMKPSRLDGTGHYHVVIPASELAGAKKVEVIATNEDGLFAGYAEEPVALGPRKGLDKVLGDSVAPGR